MIIGLGRVGFQPGILMIPREQASKALVEIQLPKLTSL